MHQPLARLTSFALASASGLILVAIAAPAQALTYTYRISGTYNTNQTISGYFNWDGSAMSNGSLTMGQTPEGSNQSWFGAPVYYTNTSPNPNRILLYWNGGGTGNDGVVLRLSLNSGGTASQALPTGTLGAAQAFSFVQLDALSYCQNGTVTPASGTTGTATVKTGNGAPTCGGGTYSYANLSLTNGLAQAPAPLSALMLLPLAGLSRYRRRYGALVANNRV